MFTLLRSTRIKSSHSSKPHISALFLQLPPAYRYFHASPRAQFIDTAIQGTHTLLESLHTVTGLPWAYTIPLTALSIRLTCVLPLAIVSRRANRQQVSLAPLMSAWSHPLRQETIKEVGHLGPVVANSRLLAKTRQKRNEIYKRHGCSLWKSFLPLLQVPIWLAAVETVRKMCGKESGLLGMFADRIRGEETAVAEYGIPIEQSFANEGALWFPDLLAADPQMVLPFMLSGAILLNLSNASGKGVWQKRLTRSLGLVGLMIGPLTLQFPSAMLIYWISSSMLAYIQAAMLNRLMPIEAPVTPCKPRRRDADLEDEK